MDSLSIDFKKKSVKGTVSAKLFQSDGFWIAYIPSLDISSYAETEDEAQENLFKVYLHEFFDSLLKSPKDGLDELEELGWKQNQLFKKKFTSESYVDKDGFLKQFDLPMDTKVIERELELTG